MRRAAISSRPATRAAVGVGLAATLIIALVALPLLGMAPNRLAAAVPSYRSGAIGTVVRFVMGFGAIGLFILAVSRQRMSAAVALLSLWAALVMLVVGLGDGARDLAAGRPAATRVSLASGAWLAMLLLASGIGWAIQVCRLRRLGAVVALVAAACLAAAGKGALFDHLSIAIELQARRGEVTTAILQHLALAGSALGLGLVLAVMLSSWSRGQALVGAVAGGIQVVPAVALLGALVALTSSLLTAVPALREMGLSALGPGPAIVGIAAYLLLPLWRGLATGLRTADGAVIDAAKALGLSHAQILLQVRLPLGSPLLIGALRVAAVQSLSLATLCALVGAGGLGRIVFDGMAQFAPDLILLGALPIIGLSLCAETLLGSIEARARAWCPA
ncbi:MAG: ABC transporter permease subunit [Methylobacterium sp.]|uniref:ABC transporter permease n=1 Tax=Methylobacterium sp. TaxID=409 RepID=UPI0025F73B31|nr:ABC transporter permease subunit [Methylobacterium sp.]MBX9934508.1 ABC transporter permease subunit [Methylobacterium sp.]